jgi:phosphoglucomutase
MTIHPLAGKPPPRDLLIDADHLQREYHTRKPDFTDRAQRVSFGTSGHRGSSLRGSFNEWHVLAITQAICDYRSSQGISGPLFIGKDTHALSEPAFITALEVLAANGVETMIDLDGGCTATPAVSHAILTCNLERATGLADGIVITPSHNPPEDGGLKYNPSSGGPADTAVTRWIEDRANHLISSNLGAVARVPYENARRAATTHTHDYVGTYVADLSSVVAYRGSAAQDRGRSAGRSKSGVLGSDCRPIRTRVGGRERQDGSNVPLHVAGLGRPNPNGLFVVLCHGKAD